MTNAVVVQKGDRRRGQPAAMTRTEDVGDDLAVPARSNNQNHRLMLPMNSCAVAWPGWLIPSRDTTFHTVSARIFASSQSDW